MKICIANDHAGTELKNKIMDNFKHDWVNLGTDASDSVDYPDFVHPLAEKVEHNEVELGILICGSGNGVCMTANKHKGVRAALCWNEELSALAKQHNNANVLCIPARFVSEGVAFQMVEKFLSEPFEGGRHQRRVEKINC